jgi:hypothetical protein
MRLLHSAARTSAGFEAENVVSLAGLVPVMRLSQEAGLPDLIAERVQLGTSIGCNPAGKIAAIVAGMVAGADSIEDLDVLRHGGMGRLFEAVYAPSTLGSFLREFTFGHVRQLDSAARSLLVSLAASCPRLTEGAAAWTYVDVDSLLRRTYGKAKQGAGFGHTKVGGYPVLLRGLSPLMATISTDTAAPVIAATRLRGGNAGSARGAASLVAEALGTARESAPAAPVGAENRVTASRQGVRGHSADLVGTVHSPRSMISRLGHPTRVPHVHSSAELFTAAFDAVFADAGIRIIRAPVRAPQANAIADAGSHAAPRMPRPPPDHRTALPRCSAARVCPALQHAPSAPIAASAPARRRHSSTFRRDHPTAAMRPARRPAARVRARRMT